MFNGIIDSLGEVISIQKTDSYLQIAIRPDFDLKDLSLGESVSHNGICLSISAIDDSFYTVEAGYKTVEITDIAHLRVSSIVNLERALKVDSRMSGHFVSAHVDGLVELISIKDFGNSYKFTFVLPVALKKYIALRGSVCLSGISLTVNELTKDTFSVMVINHTLKNTNFQFLRVGNKINIEVDLLARYIAKLLEKE